MGQLEKGNSKKERNVGRRGRLPCNGKEELQRAHEEHHEHQLRVENGGGAAVTSYGSGTAMRAPPPLLSRWTYAGSEPEGWGYTSRRRPEGLIAMVDRRFCNP